MERTHSEELVLVVSTMEPPLRLRLAVARAVVVVVLVELLIVRAVAVGQAVTPNLF